MTGEAGVSLIILLAAPGPVLLGIVLSVVSQCFDRRLRRRDLLQRRDLLPSTTNPELTAPASGGRGPRLRAAAVTRW